MSSRPWGKLAFPDRSTSSFARRGRFRGASAPLSRLDMNAASRPSVGGGGDRNRTDDLLLAKQALSQLSYTPSVLSEAQNPIAAPAAPLRRDSRSRRTERSLFLLCAALAVQAHRCRGPRFGEAETRGGPGRI
jgi:hypothetical protein